jgi:pullulanase
LKTKNKDIFEYVKALIKLRKEHPAFRMRTTEEITNNLVFLEKLPDGVVGYTINGVALKDSWKKIRVYFNGNKEIQATELDNKNWKVAILNNQMATDQNLPGPLILKPYSCVVLYQL